MKRCRITTAACWRGPASPRRSARSARSTRRRRAGPPSARPALAGPRAYYSPPPPPVYYYPPPVYYTPPPATAVPPVAQDQAPGQTCREYQSTTTIDGRPQRTYGTACLQPDGTWQIVR